MFCTIPVPFPPSLEVIFLLNTGNTETFSHNTINNDMGTASSEFHLGAASSVEDWNLTAAVLRLAVFLSPATGGPQSVPGPSERLPPSRDTRRGRR